MSEHVARQVHRPPGQVIVTVFESGSGCKEHEPVRSAVQLLGEDGEYESAPATLCRNCKKLLAVDTGN